MTPLIQTVPETDSTNEDMLILAANGGEEGRWLRAETQTAGRGRMGRGWHSPVGNLYASTIVRLQPADPPGATLALVAAIALVETCRSSAPGIGFLIKWPNDVQVDGAKLAGILLERGGDAVVAGFGVNLGFHPVGLDRPVISLAALGVDRPDPGHFCEDLATQFALWLAVWRGEGLSSIRDEWCARAHPEGTPLIANLADGGTATGTFAGLADDCALLLRLADGTSRAIHAGDVFLV